MGQYERLDTPPTPIYFQAGHEESARLLAAAAQDTASIVSDHWGLKIPAGCRAYVLMDWEGFLDHATPRHLRLLTRLTKPLWRRRVERTFRLAGGWMVPWRGSPTVAVKPAQELSKVEAGLGERLFEPVPDLTEKMRHLACHELTHASTAHLRLPAWLNEGLAMRAVDHLVDQQTVLEETRDLAYLDPGDADARAYRRVRAQDHDALIRLYATGYWATRRLEEQGQQVLRQLLASKRSPRVISREARLLLGVGATGERAS